MPSWKRSYWSQKDPEDFFENFDSGFIISFKFESSEFDGKHSFYFLRTFFHPEDDNWTSQIPKILIIFFVKIAWKLVFLRTCLFMKKWFYIMMKNIRWFSPVSFVLNSTKTERVDSLVRIPKAAVSPKMSLDLPVHSA